MTTHKNADTLFSLVTRMRALHSRNDGISQYEATVTKCCVIRRCVTQVTNVRESIQFVTEMTFFFLVYFIVCCTRLFLRKLSLKCDSNVIIQ